MTQEKLFKEITSGKIFTAEFIKKDKTRRVINCRTNVKKFTNGKGLSFDPIARNLLPVYDLKVKDYRFINLSTLISVTIKGQKYFINDIIINDSIDNIKELNKTILR
jgi:predicted lipase